MIAKPKPATEPMGCCYCDKTIAVGAMFDHVPNKGPRHVACMPWDRHMGEPNGPPNKQPAVVVAPPRRNDPESRLRKRFAGEMLDRFDAALAVCKSPIERLFLLAAYHEDHFDLPGRYEAQFDQGGCVGVGPDGFLYAQREIGKYVADFLIQPPTPLVKVVVECDGHDFHQRTKDQAEHDKKRDRWMTTAGYTVVRFTGSEFWRDADGCFQQAMDALRAAVKRVT